MLLHLIAALTVFVYADVKFVFDQPTEISQPTADGLSDKQNVAAGAEFKFDNTKVYWVQSKGRVPMLVLPQLPSGNQAPLKVQIPEVAAWPPTAVQYELDIKLSQLVSDLTMFQEALRRRNTADAERALARMEQVGRLDYLHFLRATLKFVQGDLEAAKESTKRGLQRHPANEEGLKFLKRLEGGR